MHSSPNNLPERRIVIAVDGFSSCGKSTFARLLAARLGYIFIDTGAMYRAVTLYGIEHGAVRGGAIDRDRLVGMLDDIAIAFRFNAARGASDIYVNGVCVEDRIRGIEVSEAVSRVSRIPEVRAKLVALQQRMGAEKGVVMDGRDIGTVVFPDAELKLYMTADPKIRAHRRYLELQERGEEVSEAEIERNIRERDEADLHREISPLRKAPDAIELDNSRMTLEEQMAWIEPILAERIHAAGGGDKNGK